LAPITFQPGKILLQFLFLLFQTKTEPFLENPEVAAPDQAVHFPFPNPLRETEMLVTASICIAQGTEISKTSEDSRNF